MSLFYDTGPYIILLGEWKNQNLITNIMELARGGRMQWSATRNFPRRHLKMFFVTLFPVKMYNIIKGLNYNNHNGLLNKGGGEAR